MTKVITDLELLEKLEPHLEDVETEYYLNYKWEVKENIFNEWFLKTVNWIKTLTTDEMFEFIWKAICYFTMPYPNDGMLNWWLVIWDEEIKAKDFNEYLQKCIIYLLDNNLLWN